MTTDDHTGAREPAGDGGEPAGFPQRLATLIGDLSVRAFARKAGVSDTFLRQCLAGRTEPTRTKLLALARAGGASVEWLATGRGDAPAPAASTPYPDRELLAAVIEATETVLDETGRHLSPARKARLMATVYDTHAGADRRPISRDAIIELLAGTA